MPVRALTPDDAELYAVLRREMLTQAPRAFGSSPGEGRGEDPVLLRASLGPGPHTGYAIIGAFADGPPGAAPSPALLAVAGIIRESQLKRRHIAMLWGVYTTPSARARGLARAVVAAAIAQARAWTDPPVAQVQLSVSDSAPEALALYQSLGFSPWGREPDALRIDHRGCDEIHMTLRL